MQKNKKVILQCLKARGTADRFKIRQYFQMTTKATNASELMRNLDALEKVECINNDKGNYSITKKGADLLNLLTEVAEILT